MTMYYLLQRHWRGKGDEQMVKWTKWQYHFLECFLRLYKATPAPVVYFLAGSLPSSALLHLRQFYLLSMIARLGQENILHQHGQIFRGFFLSEEYAFSIPSLILLRLLPVHLNYTHTGRRQASKQKVLDFLKWGEVLKLESLHVQFMSLTHIPSGALLVASLLRSRRLRCKQEHSVADTKLVG